jgi:hypothetical protein
MTMTPHAWLSLLLAVLSVAAHGATPVEDPVAVLVRTWLVRDGVRASADTLRAAATPLCPKRPAACLVAASDIDDPALPDRFAAACELGDPAACLGAAWLLLPLSSPGRDPAHPSDPARFGLLVKRACDAGLVDGCVEVGLRYGLGAGTYRSAQRATGILRPLCTAGYGRACTALGRANGEPNLVKMGAAAGDPSALAESRQQHEQRAACDAGHTGACLSLAVREADHQAAATLYDRVCALGDVEGCVTRIRADAAHGALSPAQAADALDAFCPRSQTACEEAAFYRQGATPVVRYPGDLSAVALDRKMIATRQERFACYLALLQTQPSAEGEQRAVVRLEVDGLISGVYLPDPFNQAYAECIADALLGFPVAAPFGGAAARVELALVAAHGAGVRIRSDSTDALRFTQAVMSDVPGWEGPLDRCFLDYDRPEPNVTLELTLRAGRSGRLDGLKVVQSTETPEVDDCVLDFLAQRQTGSATLPTTLEVEIRSRRRLGPPRRRT